MNLRSDSRGGKALSVLLILGLTMGFAGSAAAINFDQFGDRVCQFNMASALMPFCAVQLESEISSTAPDEIQFEVYTDAIVNHDRREQLTKEQRSHLNQTFGMAMAQAKLTVIEELNNGSSEGTAQQAALEEIRDYYTTHQVKVLSHQEREVYALNRTVNTIKETDGLGIGDVLIEGQDTYNQCTSQAESGQGTKGFEFQKRNKTLHNNSVRSYTSVEVIATDNGEKCTLLTSDQSVFLSDMAVLNASSGRGDSVEAYNGKTHQQTLDMIDSRETKAENNVINLTSALYDEYEPGEMNTSDMLGPLETLVTASTNYEDTGSYSYLALSLEQAGLAHNSSYAFQVQWNNSGESEKTAWGQLFVPRGTFNNTLEVNKTYDASGKTVIFVHNTEDGKATETDLDGSFKILNMRDTESGESINSTSLQSSEFHTDGVQDLQKQLDELREQQDRVTTCSSCGGIIGPTGSWFADLFNDIFPDLPDLSADAVGGIAVAGSIVLLIIAVILG